MALSSMSADSNCSNTPLHSQALTGFQNKVIADTQFKKSVFLHYSIAFFIYPKKNFQLVLVCQLLLE